MVLVSVSVVSAACYVATECVQLAVSQIVSRPYHVRPCPILLFLKTI